MFFLRVSGAQHDTEKTLYGLTGQRTKDPLSHRAKFKFLVWTQFLVFEVAAQPLSACFDLREI